MTSAHSSWPLRRFGGPRPSSPGATDHRPSVRRRFGSSGDEVIGSWHRFTAPTPRPTCALAHRVGQPSDVDDDVEDGLGDVRVQLRHRLGEVLDVLSDRLGGACSGGDANGATAEGIQSSALRHGRRDNSTRGASPAPQRERAAADSPAHYWLPGSQPTPRSDESLTMTVISCLRRTASQERGRVTTNDPARGTVPPPARRLPRLPQRRRRGLLVTWSALGIRSSRFDTA